MLEKLEERRLLAVSPILAGKNNTEIPLDTDGTQLDYNFVTVRFDGEVQLGDNPEAGFGLRGYAINPLSGGQQQIVIPTSEHQILQDENGDDTIVRFKTEFRARKGGRLYLYEGALRDLNGDDVLNTPSDAIPNIRLEKGLNKPRFTLALRPFVPYDFTFFNKDFFDASPDPITRPVLGPNELRADLASFLADRGLEQSVIDQAVAQFDDSTVQTRVPDATLRAGLLSLYGTDGEPAIDAILGTLNPTGQPYTILGYDTTLPPEVRRAESKLENGRLRLIFKQELADEHYASLGALIAHEVMHNDVGIVQNEEIVAHLVEASVWADHIQTRPAIARYGTPNVTEQNGRLVALLNSGDRLYPRTGILGAPLNNEGNEVYVNGSGLFADDPISFEDEIRQEFEARGVIDGALQANTSPITDILLNLLEPGDYTFENFNTSLLETIDANQRFFGDAEAVAVAGILKMAPQPMNINI
ncbi:MAG: hypothetical protein AAGD32_02130 [Planctomycetota bacterium]